MHSLLSASTATASLLLLATASSFAAPVPVFSQKTESSPQRTKTTLYQGLEDHSTTRSGGRIQSSAHSTAIMVHGEQNGAKVEHPTLESQETAFHYHVPPQQAAMRAQPGGTISTRYYGDMHGQLVKPVRVHFNPETHRAEQSTISEPQRNKTTREAIHIYRKNEPVRSGVDWMKSEGSSLTRDG